MDADGAGDRERRRRADERAAPVVRACHGHAERPAGDRALQLDAGTGLGLALVAVVVAVVALALVAVVVAGRGRRDRRRTLGGPLGRRASSGYGVVVVVGGAVVVATVVVVVVAVVVVSVVVVPVVDAPQLPSAAASLSPFAMRWRAA